MFFDRDGDVLGQLRKAAPDLVVDASGPFQVYGDPYRVVRAAIAAGIDYLDLADGSDFVKGIAQLDHGREALLGRLGQRAQHDLLDGGR